MYEKGGGNLLNYIERAAALDYPDAFLNLATVYDEGSCGFVQDNKKVFNYYKRYDDLGNEKAQLIVGLEYEKEMDLKLI
ncbi:hypothetical protein M9Y10_004068 [Tritrichomonas musculus]|uniref:Sel1 repeat family protein n=1 Tax=Tritrichomonas musculus TaxID=1915356 RepID=A0ABR2JR98_9EUKA